MIIKVNIGISFYSSMFICLANESSYAEQQILCWEKTKS